MKFSKEFISTLKNFSTINHGIKLNKGNHVMTRNVSGTIYAETLLPEGQEIDADLAIYDLNGFLSILSMTDENAEIKVKSSEIVIHGSRSKITWPIAEDSAVVSPPRKMNFPPENLTFNITSDDYKQLLRISRAVGADTLCITNDDEAVVFKAYNSDVDSSLKKPLSTYKVAEYNSNADFNFIIDMDNMKMPPDNYTVKLWANGQSNFAAQFIGETANYILAVQADSTHNF